MSDDGSGWRHWPCMQPKFSPQHRKRPLNVEPGVSPERHVCLHRPEETHCEATEIRPSLTTPGAQPGMPQLSLTTPKHQLCPSPTLVENELFPLSQGDSGQGGAGEGYRDILVFPQGPSPEGARPDLPCPRAEAQPSAEECGSPGGLWVKKPTESRRGSESGGQRSRSLRLSEPAARLAFLLIQAGVQNCAGRKCPVRGEGPALGRGAPPARSPPPRSPLPHRSTGLALRYRFFSYFSKAAYPGPLSSAPPLCLEVSRACINFLIPFLSPQAREKTSGPGLGRLLRGAAGYWPTPGASATAWGVGAPGPPQQGLGTGSG